MLSRWRRTPLPEEATANKRVALTHLRKTAKPLAVLLVLDDVWDRAHALHLNFVDATASSSAVLVTSRIRGLLDGAAQVPCELLSQQAALQLLLRTGGVEQLLERPPAAATEAVELCGRLPLTLAVAGSMLEQFGGRCTDEFMRLITEDRGEMLREGEFGDMHVRGTS